MPSEKCRLAISRFPPFQCLSLCLSLQWQLLCLYGRESIINTVGTMDNNGQHNRAFVLPRVPPDRCQMHMYMYMYFRYPRTDGAVPVFQSACRSKFQGTTATSHRCVCGTAGRFSSPKDIIHILVQIPAQAAIPPGSNSASLSKEQAPKPPHSGKTV